MQIITRIFDLLQKNDKTAYQLSRYLGINTSTMSTWKKNETDPPARLIKQIADFFNVSVSYILTGEDDPIYRYTTTDEDEFLDLFRQLPERKQFEFIGQLKGTLQILSESDKYVDKEKRQSN